MIKFILLLFFSNISLANTFSLDPLKHCPTANKLANSWTENGWNQTADENGFRSFSKKIEGSNLRLIGGDGIINKPFIDVMKVIQEKNKNIEWVDRALEIKIIENKDDIEMIFYSLYKAPFPLDDREFLVYSNLEWKDDLKGLLMTTKSVEDSRSPKKGVRAISNGSNFAIPLEGGKKTYLYMEYALDPKGAVPSFVVNLVQKNWATKTLNGLNKRVQSYTSGPMPVLEKTLNKYFKEKEICQ